jgi:hypothetical protein
MRVIVEKRWLLVGREVEQITQRWILYALFSDLSGTELACPVQSFSLPLTRTELPLVLRLLIGALLAIFMILFQH